MKNVIFVSIFFWQVSCTNSEGKTDKEHMLDYPLVEFYINDSICNDNISFDSNKNVNDLKIDSSSKLIVSFDCIFSGDIDSVSIERISLKEDVCNFCDTIFLNYSFKSNSQIIKPLQRRLYYGITDRNSYQKCKFIPREL